MKVVFLGTPSFALPSLYRLHQSPHTVVGVITPPAKPAGRGKKLLDPPVAEATKALNLPLLQTEDLKDPAILSWLKEHEAEALVVVAYGVFIPKKVLTSVPFGGINLHPSLLPRWRGPSPIATAILEGDEVTGVTTMGITAKMDAGPIYLQEREPILPEDTQASLSQRLSKKGAQLLVETLNQLEKGTLKPQPQDDTQATYTKLIKKADGLIHWHFSAERLARQVRAFNPWPGSFTYWRGKRFYIWKARALPQKTAASPPPGTLLEITADYLLVACGSGVLALEEVQREGRKPLSARAFSLGARLNPHEIFGDPERSR